jgi:uracil-DNA glycosylase
MDSLADAIGTVPDDWRLALGEAASETNLVRIGEFVARECEAGPVYPPADKVFAALALTPLASVHAVILGQDPYHGPGEAHGLAFSVPDGVRIPPSLRNIRQELRDDVGFNAPASGSLERWARNGVLLLNTALTVRAGEAGSHANGVWASFTTAVIAAVAAKHEPVAFLLWGKAAQKSVRLFAGTQHPVIASAHPSPFSARRGFFCSQPFSRANDALASLGAAPIDWRL